MKRREEERESLVRECLASMLLVRPCRTSSFPAQFGRSQVSTSLKLAAGLICPRNASSSSGLVTSGLVSSGLVTSGLVTSSLCPRNARFPLRNHIIVFFPPSQSFTLPLRRDALISTPPPHPTPPPLSPCLLSLHTQKFDTSFESHDFGRYPPPPPPPPPPPLPRVMGDFECVESHDFSRHYGHNVYVCKE